MNRVDNPHRAGHVFEREGHPALCWTEAGKGTPVLFVHGLTGTAGHDWSPQLADLVRDHRVISLDLRGHGSSELGQVGLSSSVGADDVYEFVEAHVGAPVHACGFSYGAGVLLTLADRDPGLFSSLTLVGPSYRFDGDHHRRFLATRDRWPEALRRLHRGDDDFEQLLVLGERDWLDMDLDPGRWADWEFPLLVVVGERDDPSKLEQAREIAQAVRKSSCLVVPDAGHMVQLDRPHVVTKAIRALVQTA